MSKKERKADVYILETVTSVSHCKFLFHCEGGRRPLPQPNQWYLVNLSPQVLCFPVVTDNKDRKKHYLESWLVVLCKGMLQ